MKHQYPDQFEINSTFKWVADKREGAFVVLDWQWSSAKADVLYTVKYFDNARIRRYTHKHIERAAVFTGILGTEALDKHFNTTPNASSLAPIASRDALARVTDFNPFEQRPEPAKRLATVHDILDACVKRYGQPSKQLENRANWYKYVIDHGIDFTRRRA